MIEYTEYTKMLIGLLAIVNPIGAIPIFVSLTSDYSAAERNALSRTVVISFFIILILSLFIGDLMLEFFGITISSFRVAGGILILLMAISMMHAQTSATVRTSDEVEESASMASIGVVPLAIPLLAGPGAISTIILYANRGSGMMHYALICSIVFVMTLILYVSLKSTPFLSNHITKTGINIFTRIMGLILAAIAIEFIANGLKGLFPSLV